MTAAPRSCEYTLPLADPEARLETVGGKGASLARLVAADVPVPDGFHVTTAAYRQFVDRNDLQPGILAALEPADVSQPATLEAASEAIRGLFAGALTPPEVASAIVRAYGSLPGSDPIVAVRSSATAEDLPDLSFAGQQETFLNVEGLGGVLEAVKDCWASLWTARAIGYRARHKIGPDGLSLAVVVQLLVPAEAAGILFTANPINGQRTQAVISAAWGLGEAVVGGLVTPDMLTVDKTTGQVLEREIGDKQVMTVRVDDPISSGDTRAGRTRTGRTEEKPVPDALRRAPVLDDKTAAELVQLGVQIEELYGMPMDIEWALADGALAIVQARPITALPQPELPVPTGWPMPDPKGSYMRGSIADFMPDPLTPLFASLGVPAINAAMQRTMTEMIGGTASFVSDYLTTVNDYAYLSVRLVGCRDWLWILGRMVPALPRLLRGGERHWREVARPRYAEAVARWQDRPPQELTSSMLIEGVDDLMNAAAGYLTSLQVDAIGTAAGTEGLFTAIYDKWVRRAADPAAPTYLLGADSTPIQAEKSLYDLAQWCRERDSLAAVLLGTPSGQIADQLGVSGDPPRTAGHGAAQGASADDWQEWQHRFRAHLEQFGHSIYDLDFAKPLPVDEPLPLLETLKLFIRGEGKNPHTRQQKSLERREQATEVVLARAKGLKLRLFRWTLRWAQTFALVREDSIFDIGLGYPTLRRMLHELGRRFVKGGAIAQRDDIFWLNRDEVQQAAAAHDRDEELPDLRERVQERRAMWQAEKRATPPQQLPAKGKVMGINVDAFMPVSAEDQKGGAIKGVGASPGQVTATARILLGPEDFHQMQPGDILVAEITTPAWTPLFAMAAGVVTDIGGPLSHGSIVAREYGIPAVLGTGVATQRIRSGQVITVDGSAGEVALVEG